MTNGEAIGYMIMSMKELGYSDDVIKKVEGKMLYTMDMNSEDVANKVYIEF